MTEYLPDKMKKQRRGVLGIKEWRLETVYYILETK
jgi:hypothetical protein